MVLITILSLCALNFIMTIAIAGSVARLIKSLGAQKPDKPTQLVELPNAPTYADIARFSSPNYDGFNPRPANWDGVPREKQ